MEYIIIASIYIKLKIFDSGVLTCECLIFELYKILVINVTWNLNKFYFLKNKKKEKQLDNPIHELTFLSLSQGIIRTPYFSEALSYMLFQSHAEQTLTDSGFFHFLMLAMYSGQIGSFSA